MPFMAYSPSHIANFMLDKAAEEGRPISQMKLLKLIFMGYGWALAVLNQRLFEEPIYAWAHGPVVRSIYDEFKHYGKQPIEGRSIEFDLEKEEIVIPRVPTDDTNAQIVLGKVWDVYKDFSAWSLRNLTHEPGSPWDAVYRPDGRDIEIPDNLIAAHFKAKIGQYIANAGQR